MTIKFITVCPSCSTVKLNEFKGMGESHAGWLTEQAAGIQWTCHACGFSGKMPVRDVEVVK
jgi:hypothetical protein